MSEQANILLGRNVRRLREERGLGASVLSQVLGWTEQEVADLESGRRDTHLDDVDSIASALKVAPEDLFSGVE